MKKTVWTKTAALALAALGLTACGAAVDTSTAETTETASAADAAAESTGDLLAQIQQKGELTIALEGDWAPWGYHDESDNLVGYDVEVGEAIAEKLGVKATFIEGSWDGLLAGVEAGRYDMVINGVDVTPDREEEFDFTDPYAYIHTVLVAAADNTDINSFEDLKGKTTANSVGSTYMEMGEEYGATCSGVDTLDETIQMVLQGRADATLNADVSIYDYMNQYPDAAIKIVAQTDDANEVAIPLRKSEDTATLREAVNKALSEMHEDGTLTELAVKYFGSDVSQK